MLLVPWAFNQAATFHAVTDRKAGGIRGKQPPGFRLDRPDPHRPKDGNGQAFHVTRRNVDDEVSDLPTGAGFQVLADSADMPPVNIGRGWLQDVPCFAHEVTQGQRQRVPPRFGVAALALFRRLREYELICRQAPGKWLRD